MIGGDRHARVRRRPATSPMSRPCSGASRRRWRPRSDARAPACTRRTMLLPMRPVAPCRAILMPLVAPQRVVDFDAERFGGRDERHAHRGGHASRRDNAYLTGAGLARRTWPRNRQEGEVGPARLVDRPRQTRGRSITCRGSKLETTLITPRAPQAIIANVSASSPHMTARRSPSRRTSSWQRRTLPVASLMPTTLGARRRCISVASALRSIPVRTGIL